MNHGADSFAAAVAAVSAAGTDVFRWHRFGERTINGGTVCVSSTTLHSMELRGDDKVPEEAVETEEAVEAEDTDHLVW